MKWLWLLPLLLAGCIDAAPERDPYIQTKNGSTFHTYIFKDGSTSVVEQTPGEPLWACWETADGKNYCGNLTRTEK